MSMPRIHPRHLFDGVLAKVAQIIIGTVVFGAIVALVAYSPVAMDLMDRPGRDWAKLGDMGQAYGPVSALVSTLALGIVLLVQRSQVRHDRRLKVREMHVDVLQIAIDDPVYGQCWGPRTSPARIDERLFYYTNLILIHWWYAWENGEIRDSHVRSYARAMFDSEVPREYWRLYGADRLSAARGRRVRFYRMVEEAFREAEREGPPSRRMEPLGPAAITVRRAPRRTSKSYPRPSPFRTISSKDRH